MGTRSNILSATEIREKKRAARAVLTNLKGDLKSHRKELTAARGVLKSATSIFGKAERTVLKQVRAVEKQQERIAAL